MGSTLFIKAFSYKHVMRFSTREREFFLLEFLKKNYNIFLVITFIISKRTHLVKNILFVGREITFKYAVSYRQRRPTYVR